MQPDSTPEDRLQQLLLNYTKIKTQSLNNSHINYTNKILVTIKTPRPINLCALGTRAMNYFAFSRFSYAPGTQDEVVPRSLKTPKSQLPLSTQV